MSNFIKAKMWMPRWMPRSWALMCVLASILPLTITNYANASKSMTRSPASLSPGTKDNGVSKRGKIEDGRSERELAFDVCWPTFERSGFKKDLTLNACFGRFGSAPNIPEFQLYETRNLFCSQIVKQQNEMKQEKINMCIWFPLQQGN